MDERTKLLVAELKTATGIYRTLDRSPEHSWYWSGYRQCLFDLTQQEGPTPPNKFFERDDGTVVSPISVELPKPKKKVRAVKRRKIIPRKPFHKTKKEKK